MIKIGILSFAHHHGEAYISNLRRMEGVELLGVADDDLSRGEKIAQAKRSALSFHLMKPCSKPNLMA